MLSGEIDFILKCVAPDLKTLPGVRRGTHRRAARAQRQDVADAAQFQGRRHGADGKPNGEVNSAALLEYLPQAQSLRSLRRSADRHRQNQVEEHEAEQNRCLAAIADRTEASRGGHMK